MSKTWVSVRPPPEVEVTAEEAIAAALAKTIQDPESGLVDCSPHQVASLIAGDDDGAVLPLRV
jgi:hypothetical protein